MMKRFRKGTEGEFIATVADGKCILTCIHSYKCDVTKEEVLEELMKEFRRTKHRWLSDDTVVIYDVSEDNCKGLLYDLAGGGEHLEDLE